MTQHGSEDDRDWLRRELALSEAEWRRLPEWAKPVVVPGERELTQWERDVAESMAAAGWRVRLWARGYRLRLRLERERAYWLALIKVIMLGALILAAMIILIGLAWDMATGHGCTEVITRGGHVIVKRACRGWLVVGAPDGLALRVRRGGGRSAAAPLRVALGTWARGLVVADDVGGRESAPWLGHCFPSSLSGRCCRDRRGSGRRRSAGRTCSGTRGRASAALVAAADVRLAVRERAGPVRRCLAQVARAEAAAGLGAGRARLGLGAGLAGHGLLLTVPS